MENTVNNTGEENPRFFDKYGVWIILLGLVALIFVFKYILVFIDKIW